MKFGIIGCGRIAERHAMHIANYAELKGTYDIVPDRAKKLAEKYNAIFYDSFNSMLNNKEIDVISICSPNGFHAEHTIKAFRKGKHVLCEKPMSISVHDCGEMIKEAEKANRRLFVVKQNRFNPTIIALKNALDNNKLGRIYSFQLSCFWNRNLKYYENNWKGTKDLDGGTLFTQFSHFIDLLYWLFGDVKNVSSILANYHHKGIIEFEDTGIANLEFYNGIIGTLNYTVNCHEKNMEGSLTVFGEKGTIKIGGQYLNELEYQNIKNYTINGLPEGNPPNDYGTYQGSMSNHDKVIENLLQVLENGGIIATNGFEGLKTVEIIDKIYSNSKWIE